MFYAVKQGAWGLSQMPTAREDCPGFYLLRVHSLVHDSPLPVFVSRSISLQPGGTINVSILADPPFSVVLVLNKQNSCRAFDKFVPPVHASLKLPLKSLMFVKRG